MDLKILASIIAILLSIIAWLISKTTGGHGKIEEIDDLSGELDDNDKDR
jgi:hypothetical protein